MSSNSHEVCNFIEKRLQQMCFSVNISEVLGTAFFIEQSEAFELIRKEFKKRKLVARLFLL